MELRKSYIYNLSNIYLEYWGHTIFGNIKYKDTFKVDFKKVYVTRPEEL